MSRPGFYFYTGDWIKDTRCLSLEARGGWLDLLCVLIERDGSVTWPLHTYEQYWGTGGNADYESPALRVLNELEQSGVAEMRFFDKEKELWITVMSRRITREHNDRENNKKRQSKHRESRKSNGSVTPKYSASSSSSSTSHISLGDSSHKNAQSPDSPSAGFEVTEKRKGDFEMGRSMNLSPALKEIADKIYKSDRDKFQKIAAWIGQGRKHNYLESDMAEALSQFWEYRFIDDWYPYLDSILDKVVKNRNSREHDLETDRLKREAREFTEGKPALSLVRGLSDAKAAK